MTKLPKHFRVKKRTVPVILMLCCVLTIILLGSGATYAWYYYHPSSIAHTNPVVPLHTFKPVVGDVHDPEDDDPDITVEQALIPGFQFQRGGYTLSGKVIDSASGQPVASAVVWVDLPVQEGRPTSIPLHTVTDVAGNYQFLHLATGSYTIIASRYYNAGDNHYYKEHVFSSVNLKGNRSNLLLSLTPIPFPGKRTISTKQPKNIILIDLRGFYAASLLDDALLIDQTRNIRTFLQHAQLLNSIWQPYGWRPLDQYALLTGTYPQWVTYDPWPHPVPWGAPDAIDTTFWYTGGRNAHLFGQESVFDVARGYGMQTAVIASADYILSDATTRNLDVLQRYSTFASDRWLAQMEDTVHSGTQQANGFLLYGELAPLSPDDATSSPDALGDAYQQALMRADHTFGRFLNWLARQGLLQNTLIALTTSQAQANHTDADNFYGMGITGQGTSKQTFLALIGPGVVCAPSAKNTVYSSFIIAPILLQASGLPAPAEARASSPFQGKECV